MLSSPQKGTDAETAVRKQGLRGRDICVEKRVETELGRESSGTVCQELGSQGHRSEVPKGPKWFCFSRPGR